MPTLINDKAKRITQTGFQRHPPIAPVIGHTDSRKPIEPSGYPIPSPDQMIVRIGDKEMAFGIDRNPGWPRETGRHGFNRTLIPIFLSSDDDRVNQHSRPTRRSTS